MMKNFSMNKVLGIIKKRNSMFEYCYDVKWWIEVNFVVVLDSIIDILVVVDFVIE